MKGHPNLYSAEELAWIESHRGEPRRVAHAAFVARFGRHDISLGAYTGLCKRKGWATGRTGHYPKGQQPWNAGKSMPYNANSARTRFKKGNRPHNTKFEGHERLTKDGYVEISIAEINPHTGFERRYVQKHRHLWEKENGAVPEGMCLKCLDGNRRNTAPSNWEAVPRALVPHLQGRYGLDYDGADPALRPAIMAIAKLKHRRNKLAGKAGA